MDNIIILKIDKLFDKNNGEKYLIPIYQRNYAWEKEQIQDLIWDIYDNENDNYYLGTLIVNKRQGNIFEVVDGQQRLTTLFLLLKALNYDINSPSLEFEARDISNKMLSCLDDEHFDEFENNEIKTGYKNVKEILNTLHTEKKNPNAINTLKENLKKVSILRVMVPQHVDLNHYFEIMNTRGEQLELHEIAKNAFISKIEGQKEKETVSRIWDACSDMDGYVQMKFSEEERRELFTGSLNDFTCSNFDEIVKVLKLDANNISVTLNKVLEDYNINESSKSENKMPKHKDDISADKKGYESIINFSNFLLQVKLVLKPEKAEEDYKRLDDKELLTNLKEYYANSAMVKKFIYNLLKYRYYFDKYIIKRNNNASKIGEWSLKKLKKENNNIYPVNLGIEKYEKNNLYNKQLIMLESCCRITYTSPKTMYWIAEILKNIQGDKFSKEENIVKNLIKVLEKYCIQKLLQAKSKNRNDMQNPFGKGFDIPRIVFTYLDYLLYKEDEDNCGDFEFKFRNSIEHFYPQNPRDNMSKLDNDILNNFGNLALITTSDNSQISNFHPTTKITEWENIIPQSLKLKIMSKIVKEEQNWDEKLILEHNDKMLSILERAINKY